MKFVILVEGGGYYHFFRNTAIILNVMRQNGGHFEYFPKSFYTP